MTRNKAHDPKWYCVDCKKAIRSIWTRKAHVGFGHKVEGFGSKRATVVRNNELGNRFVNTTKMPSIRK